MDAQVRVDSTLPPDTRVEVPPGDPLGEPVTHTQMDMRSVEIATPTARTIFRAKAFFPLDIFPDEVIVDEIKVSLVNKRFFATEGVNNILIKDIKSVEINTVPFFAQLLIEGPDGAYKINFLTKNRAYLARRLVLGLMVMSERKVDTSKMEIAELVARAEELGRGRK